MTSKDKIFQLEQLKKLIHTHDTDKITVNTESIDYAIKLINAIDDIRAEIKTFDYVYIEYCPNGYEKYVSRDDVLNIINKHIGG